MRVVLSGLDAASLKLIMKIGPLPGAYRTPDRTPAGRPGERTGSGVPLRYYALEDALENALDPGFHCVRTHWIRGFMTFQLARRTRDVMLMVPT
jgi:hypothetical protein